MIRWLTQVYCGHVYLCVCALLWRVVNHGRVGPRGRDGREAVAFAQVLKGPKLGKFGGSRNLGPRFLILDLTQFFYNES
jgi:hypothetical protein